MPWCLGALFLFDDGQRRAMTGNSFPAGGNCHGTRDTAYLQVPCYLRTQLPYPTNYLPTIQVPYLRTYSLLELDISATHLPPINLSLYARAFGPTE
jgi:hypothetical protein